MKKILAVMTLMIVLVSTTASAQMGKTQSQGDQKMMGTQQSSQMMNQHMMRNMSDTMGQMNTMMQKISSTMDQDRTMDRTRTQDMSKVMDDMSLSMKEMSGHIKKGSADPAEMKKIQARMKATNEMMDRMQNTNL